MSMKESISQETTDIFTLVIIDINIIDSKIYDDTGCSKVTTKTVQKL